MLLSKVVDAFSRSPFMTSCPKHKHTEKVLIENKERQQIVTFDVLKTENISVLFDM